MPSARYFGMARTFLLINLCVILLTLSFSTYELFYRLVNGYAIAGLEQVSLWRVHLGNSLGAAQFAAIALVYHYSRRALQMFMDEGKVTATLSAFLDRLVVALCIVGALKVLTFFTFPSHYNGSFVDHFMSSKFMNRGFDDFALMMATTRAAMFVSNVISMLTLFFNPANCLLYVWLIKGIQKNTGEQAHGAR